jgi:hypothetical protein
LRDYGLWVAVAERRERTNRLRLGKSGLSSKSQDAFQVVVGRNAEGNERKQVQEAWMHDGCASKLNANGRASLVRERVLGSAVDSRALVRTLALVLAYRWDQQVRSQVALQLANMVQPDQTIPTSSGLISTLTLLAASKIQRDCCSSFCPSGSSS